MEVKDRIRNRRKELGLTMDNLAQAVGTTRQTIQKYESGKIVNIPYDKLEKLADILCTTPAVLMGWEEMEPIPAAEIVKNMPKTLAAAIIQRGKKRPLYMTEKECKTVTKFLKIIRNYGDSV